jgi:hypothetical protein
MTRAFKRAIRKREVILLTYPLARRQIYASSTEKKGRHREGIYKRGDLGSTVSGLEGKKN